MKVLRVYHAGRDPGHRGRERALVSVGVETTLAVPQQWPDPGAQQRLSAEPFGVVELGVSRAGDVNRHRYTDTVALRAVVETVRPDVIDIHEEPFSVAARQWLDVAGRIPVVLYTAQNLDKRFPPPFAQLETRAYRQARGLYPCSRQAASVVRGKGFAGVISVLPLGVAPEDFPPGEQQHDDTPFVLGLVGRLVPEKGLQDAVRVLAAVAAERNCRLLVVGEGPDLAPALELAGHLGVRDAIEVQGWGGTTVTARAYRRMHVLLVPSRATATWVEQFGRVIVEGQASGCVVAGYDSGAIAEVCAGSGAIVQERDVSGLSREVVALAQDRVRWERFRGAGRNRTADFTWDAVACGQLALYQKVVEGPAVRSTRPARAQARAEFGPPARTTVGERPIALPVLRTSPILNDFAGRLIDLTVSGLERAGRAR